MSAPPLETMPRQASWLPPATQEKAMAPVLPAAAADVQAWIMAASAAKGMHQRAAMVEPACRPQGRGGAELWCGWGDNCLQTRELGWEAG